MAHIQKRGPKRWVARYIDPGGQERAKSFERKVDAERFIAAIQHSVFSGAYVDPRAGRITFAEYASAWQAMQPHRVTTARTIERHLRVHVLPVIGSRPMGSIRRTEVQALVVAMGETLAPSTTRAVFENVRAVFRAAVVDRVVAISPCDGVALPRVTVPRVEPLRHDQVRTLVEEIDPRYRA